MAQYSPAYLNAIDEMKQFLALAKLDDFIYLLVDKGYDDLECLSEVNDIEILELENMFRTLDSKRLIRNLVVSLRNIGYKNYLLSGLPNNIINDEKLDNIQTQLPSSLLSSSFDSRIYLERFFVIIPEKRMLQWYNNNKMEKMEGEGNLTHAIITQTSPLSCKILFKTPLSVGGVILLFETTPNNKTWSYWIGLLQTCTVSSEATSDRFIKQERIFTDQLLTGLTCKKIKYGVEHIRVIWCSTTLDRVMWGEDRNNVKGFELVSELIKVTSSPNENGLRIILHFSNRDLELETKNDQGPFWVKAYQFLIDKRIMEMENRRGSLGKKQSVQDYQIKQEKFKEYLQFGPKFKRIKNGKTKIRQLWVSDDMEFLYYGDDKKSVAGKLKIKEIAQVIPSPNDALKFTIQAIDKNLDLEAANVEEREYFTTALQAYML